MKISIGCDHGGLDLKNKLRDYLVANDYEVSDKGTFTSDSCDYPDFGYAVAKDVASKSCDFGIVICSTGVGMSMVANKVKGVRCALIDNVDFARLCREHNNANCLALGAKAVSFELAKQIVNVFLETPSSTEERHVRRVTKIAKIEGEN